MAFPGTYNFNYYRGDTFSFIIRPKDSTGTAWNLTGYTAEFTIADKRGPGAVKPSLAPTAIINTINNEITCTISPTTGRELDPAIAWVYDVQITDGNSIYTVLTGSITITNDVTGAS